MSSKNIAKFLLFVIAVSTVSLTFSACEPSFKGRGPTDIGNDGISDDYLPPKVVGKIASDRVSESSGIAVSRCQAGVIWTQNDSGDGPFVYAINEKGDALGTWRVNGASNVDWEDIATFRDESGRCFLYLGEIGNNELKRTEMKIYRVPEPTVTRGSDAESETEPAVTIRFEYADGPHDAETLLVHPRSGEIFVLTKSRRDASGVYRIPAGSKPARVAKIADVSIPAIPDGLLTGGDISPDGTRLVVCDYFNAYEFLLPPGASGFDEIWKAKPLRIELGKREIGESVGYSADGRSIFATSEGKRAPVIRVDRK